MVFWLHQEPMQAHAQNFLRGDIRVDYFTIELSRSMNDWDIPKLKSIIVSN